MSIRTVVVMSPKNYLQNEIVFVSNNENRILIWPKHSGLDSKKSIKVTIEQ